MTLGPIRENDPRALTADGAKITPGLKVVNYDRRISYVDEEQFSSTSMCGVNGDYWDGWFRMRDAEGREMSTMNGERMTTRIPADLL